VAAALLFVYIALRTVIAGERVPANYWGDGATTLEWTVPSPAPHHTHSVMPEVH
jgi:cytochrome c oxidase subunit I